MEVGEAVISLDILDTELDLAVGKVLVILEVGEGYFDDAAFEFLGSDFGTGGFGDDGFSKILIGEHCRCLEFVPFFSEEGVDTVEEGNAREVSKSEQAKIAERCCKEHKEGWGHFNKESRSSAKASISE